jgi:hypothetical protein
MNANLYHGQITPLTDNYSKYLSWLLFATYKKQKKHAVFIGLKVVGTIALLGAKMIINVSKEHIPNKKGKQ